MARNDLARPRARFRLREDGSLGTGTCSACEGETYRVDEGTWLHWSTLEPACPREGAETVEKVACGPTMDERVPSLLDSPTRGLARVGLTSTYRRPSWEWMGCG